ncbi:UNVERIFIED_CONTAM: hypothetical protein FKN15_035850 [Acipenser sinensis]
MGGRRRKSCRQQQLQQQQQQAQEEISWEALLHSISQMYCCCICGEWGHFPVNCPLPEEWNYSCRRGDMGKESVRPQPKREEAERPQPKMEESVHPQPKREEAEHPQPKREEPVRPQPKRGEAKRPQPKREEPVRPQPKRREAERLQPTSPPAEGEYLLVPPPHPWEDCVSLPPPPADRGRVPAGSISIAATSRACLLVPPLQPEGEEPLPPSQPEGEEPLPPSPGAEQQELPLPPPPPEGEEQELPLPSRQDGPRQDAGSPQLPLHSLLSRARGKTAGLQRLRRGPTPAPPLVLAPLLQSPPDGPLPPSPPEGPPLPCRASPGDAISPSPRDACLALPWGCLPRTARGCLPRTARGCLPRTAQGCLLLCCCLRSLFSDLH